MNTSTIGPSTMHRAQFYLRARGTQALTPATLDEVYPRSWILRAILPDPISIQTSAQAVRAEAIGLLAKARPALAKRGLEVDFEVVAIFYK